MRTLNCPRCQTPLETRPVATASGPVVVDVCTTGCGGFWLDADDMSAGLDVTDDLQALTIAPTRTPDTTLPVNCPICDTVMVRYRWNYTSPILLDQCESGHGTWVDGGEVQAMEEFEEKDVLPTDRQAKLKAQLGMEQLEMEAGYLRGAGPRSNWLLTLVEIAWRRSL